MSFPGFMILLGSKASLIFFIVCRFSIPSSFSSTFIFPVPTPCSPVHVPDKDRAVWTMKWFSLSASLRWLSWAGSKSMTVWKFPSPA
nr:hypothetical protein Iba_chr10aCG2100 [Ipomoea batatas]GMD44585.1 hypothetical protein Iba_chr10dCG1900 [Ipomoea batatas]GMD46326.1 hypothetical protein Iba_chr10eCG2200 [Ipomoea batatas]